MIILNEKHPALKLAHTFTTGFSGAIIAGGVARDLFNDRSFSVIDIFIQHGNKVEEYEQIMAVTKFCCENKLCFEYCSDYNELNNCFSIKASDLNNVDVKLEFSFMYKSLLKLPAEKFVKTFDMVSSEAWLEPMEGGFNIGTTERFEELNERKILGIYYSKIEGYYSHINTVAKKYPDYITLGLEELA